MGRNSNQNLRDAASSPCDSSAASHAARHCQRARCDERTRRIRDPEARRASGDDGSDRAGPGSARRSLTRPDPTRPWQLVGT